MLLLARAMDAKSNATQTWECNRRYYFGAYILNYCQFGLHILVEFNLIPIFLIWDQIDCNY